MQQDLPRDHFVWLIGSLCQISRLPFDPALILQRYPAPHSFGQLLEALKSLAFRASEGAFAAAAYPCIAFLKDATPAIIVRYDGERLLYFEAGGQTPHTCAVGEAAERFRPQILLVRHEKTEALRDDGAPTESKFGFRWFWNELLRHRRIWRDVLFASLFIQLIALATPLLTQVIIDKVVVNQTVNTLIVVAVALVMFLAFSAGMSWLRQYLILHTGNRVDAVLGSQVFQRLLRLHLPYFEHRPTGTLVARMQAVETIREFMAGAAISLILDFPFLLIFVAVMFLYSWQLTLIALGIMFAVTMISILIVPELKARINRQFLLGARNQAFLTEYVAGVETVKSLQMEPRLERRYDGMLAE